MLYNGKLSGLNGDLWDPNFYLPTVLLMLISLEEGTYMVDRDTGYIFLNFMLSDKVRPF